MKPQPYTKSYSQLRNAESRRNILALGKMHQLLSPENTHASNITQTEEVYICMYLVTYIDIHKHVFDNSQ